MTNDKWKIVLAIIVILFAGLSVYLVIINPQPYGYLSLGILLPTASFLFIKKKALSYSLCVIGLAGSTFVLYAAYSFISFTNKQRSKFDIPTAVVFEKSNFETAMSKARLDNKLIFIDIYTGWCSPCLGFTQNVLTNEEVGKYMNAAFINLKYDAEKGEGIEVAKKYHINSYPTLLIVDKDGNIVENIGDSIQWVPNAEDMIAVSKKYIRE